MEPTITTIPLSGVNCYLLRQDNNFILCDTGGPLIFDKVFDNRREELIRELEKQGCCKGNLKLILLTHGDNDHVANAAFLRKTFDAPIGMHKDDLFLVNKPSMEAILINFNSRYIVINSIAKVIKKKFTKVLQHTLDEFESFLPDFYFEEGDELLSYGIDGKIFHLPGHTPGSIGVLTSQGGLIAGDTLQNVKKPGAATNAQDFKTLNKSIQKLEGMKILKAYPGHGKPFSYHKHAK